MIGKTYFKTFPIMKCHIKRTLLPSEEEGCYKVQFEWAGSVLDAILRKMVSFEEDFTVCREGLYVKLLSLKPVLVI